MNRISRQQGLPLYKDENQTMFNQSQERDGNDRPLFSWNTYIPEEFFMETFNYFYPENSERFVNGFEYYREIEMHMREVFNPVDKHEQQHQQQEEMFVERGADIDDVMVGGQEEGSVNQKGDNSSQCSRTGEEGRNQPELNSNTARERRSEEERRDRGGQDITNGNGAEDMQQMEGGGGFGHDGRRLEENVP